MTISEKSTELGIDLEQIALDSVTLNKCSNNEVFHCFVATHKGHNIRIKDDSGDIIHDGYFRYSNDSLDENSTKATVEADFKTWLGSQEFVEIPVEDIYTAL